MPLRLALAQLNPTVGDVCGNARQIAAKIGEARSAGVDVVVFPELCVTGYPPEDLLLKPDFIAAAMHEPGKLAGATRGLTAIVGSVFKEEDLHNAAVVFHDGELVGTQFKQLLPNYGVFDEHRYFAPGREQSVFVGADGTFGVTICEDIWSADGPYVDQAIVGGARLLINISASPYHAGKGEERHRMLATRAVDSMAFVAYCNIVGGQDELVFDGQSAVFAPDGELLARADQFTDDFLVVDLEMDRAFRRTLLDSRLRTERARVGKSDDMRRIVLSSVQPPSSEHRLAVVPTVKESLAPDAEVYAALVLATRDYVKKCGFSRVLLGLSGGVDSALTAVIAADAVGAANVTGVTMPTRYSSSGSVDDSRQLADNLGISLHQIPIEGIFQGFLDALAPFFGDLPAGLAEENLQPRIRGTLLMALSNKLGALVLTTGNKSEIAVGYSTLYGDTAGGFAVLKDVPKTLVYALCAYRNDVFGGDLIPRAIIDKAPSAELRPNQKDSDSLPEYDVLDPILDAYVSENLSQQGIVARGFSQDTVSRVVTLVDRNEYKRRQSPPGAKITTRAFGKDWRLPISQSYRRP